MIEQQSENGEVTARIYQCESCKKTWIGDIVGKVFSQTMNGILRPYWKVLSMLCLIGFFLATVLGGSVLLYFLFLLASFAMSLLISAFFFWVIFTGSIANEIKDSVIRART